MKKIIYITIFCLIFINSNAEGNLKFYIKKSIENNLQLNAERKKFEVAKQDKNISRSEFLPSITISGNKSSSTSTNKTDQNGTDLPDSNLDFESRTISLEQKIFNGFKGVNTFKKSELEKQKAKLKLREIEQNKQKPIKVGGFRARLQKAMEEAEKQKRNNERKS